MNSSENQHQTAQSADPQENKHSNASRLLVAGAFATVGGKVGTVGSIVDANDILKEQKLTFGRKVKAVFNGTLFKELNKQTVSIMQTEGKTMPAALAKTMKWGIITTLAGMAGGAVLGWQRGGRIDNWKDIIKHPWDSTKIIFGYKEPNNKAESKTEQTSVSQASERSDEHSAYWQNKITSTPAKTQQTAIAH